MRAFKDFLETRDVGGPVPPKQFVASSGPIAFSFVKVTHDLLMHLCWKVVSFPGGEPAGK